MKTFFNKTIKAAQRVAFLFSVFCVFAVSLTCVFGSVPLLLMICDVFSITGTLRLVCVMIFIVGPVLEFTVNIECNALAVVARLFPGYFPWRISFECFSFWKRMLHA